MPKSDRVLARRGVVTLIAAAAIATRAPAVPGSQAPAEAARSYAIVTERGFVTRLGPWHLRNPTLGRAIEVFGQPSSMVHPSGYREACRVTWRARRIKATFANFGGFDACDPGYGRVNRFTVRSSAWRTAKGLRIRNRTERIVDLYPTAAMDNGTWTLIRRDFGYGDGEPIPTVSATPREGRVAALTAYIYAAGD